MAQYFHIILVKYLIQVLIVQLRLVEDITSDQSKF